MGQPKHNEPMDPRGDTPTGIEARLPALAEDIDMPLSKAQVRTLEIAAELIVKLDGHNALLDAHNTKAAGREAEHAQVATKLRLERDDARENAKMWKQRHTGVHIALRQMQQHAKRTAESLLDLNGKVERMLRDVSVEDLLDAVLELRTGARGSDGAPAAPDDTHLAMSEEELHGDESAAPRTGDDYDKAWDVLCEALAMVDAMSDRSLAGGVLAGAIQKALNIREAQRSTNTVLPKTAAAAAAGAATKATVGEPCLMRGIVCGIDHGMESIEVKTVDRAELPAIRIGTVVTVWEDHHAPR